jgi:hypothetical protein
MRIIKNRETHHDIHYMLCFEGFAFDCDKDGKVTHPSNANYLKSIAAGPGTIEEYPNTWTEPAIGECVRCGNEVELNGFTCTCAKCGADYNQSGQLLGPRSQWSDDTGESLSDILNIDSCSTNELFAVDD